MSITLILQGLYRLRVIPRELPKIVKKTNIELKLHSFLLKKKNLKDHIEKLKSYKPVKILGKAQKEQRVE